MESDVACLDQQNEGSHEEQPERGGHGMEMDDCRNGRRLMKVVVKVEAEAHSNDDPEGGEPDERSPAIVACRATMPLYALGLTSKAGESQGRRSIASSSLVGNDESVYRPVPPTACGPA